MIQSEESSTHNIDLNHTTQKRVTITRVMTHNCSNAFSQHVNHLNWLSGLY